MRVLRKTKDAATRETLEILSDKESVEKLRRSIKAVKAGKTIPWDEARTGL